MRHRSILAAALLLALAALGAAGETDHQRPQPNESLGGVLWVGVEIGGDPVDASLTVIDEDGRTVATGWTSRTAEANPTDFILDVGTYRVIAESETDGRRRRRETRAHVAAGDSTWITVQLSGWRRGC